MSKLPELSTVFNLALLTDYKENKHLKWFGTRLLVRAKQVQDQTAAGIYLTDKQQRQEERVSNLCEVLAIGDEVEFFSVGDVVLTLQYSGRPLYIPELKGENLHVIDEADVYATIFKSSRIASGSTKKTKRS